MPRRFSLFILAAAAPLCAADVSFRNEVQPILARLGCSTGGLLQYIPAGSIAMQKPMGAKSLMLSAEQLRLTAQDLADLAAYLQTYTGSSK